MEEGESTSGFTIRTPSKLQLRKLTVRGFGKQRICFHAECFSVGREGSKE